MATSCTWNRFRSFHFEYPEVRFALDISRVPFADDFLSSMEPSSRKAFAAMAALEKGAIANPDEERMVGHYWLRAPELSPTTEIRTAIESSVKAVEAFAAKVHAAEVR